MDASQLKEDEKSQPRTMKYIKKPMVINLYSLKPSQLEKNPFQQKKPPEKSNSIHTSKYLSCIFKNQSILARNGPEMNVDSEYYNYKLAPSNSIETLMTENEEETDPSSLPSPSLKNHNDLHSDIETPSSKQAEIEELKALRTPPKSYSTTDSNLGKKKPKLKPRKKSPLSLAPEFQDDSEEEKKDQSSQDSQSQSQDSQDDQNTKKTSNKTPSQLQCSEEEKTQKPHPPHHSKRKKHRKTTEEKYLSDYYKIYEKYLSLTSEIIKNFNRLSSLSPVTQSELLPLQLSLPFPTHKKTRKTLILDLDDTLVHTMLPRKSYLKQGVNKTEIHTAVFKDSESGRKQVIKIIIRPFANEFLKAVSKEFEVVLFTAGAKEYADRVLDILDPSGVFFDYRFYREKCVRKDGEFIKDLRIFRNRSIKDVVIVDNTLAAFMNQIDNGVPIPSFLGDAKDKQLKGIKKFIMGLRTAEDVRKPIIEKYCLTELYKFYKEEKNKENKLEK